jgi:predicted DNA-binding mobile mystery protein A
MKNEFGTLRRTQLDRTLTPFFAARHETRPQRGWLRSVREALGFSLEDVGRKLGDSRQHILRFETAEANDQITLQSLRRIANAMDCELVYAIVPKTGTLTELAEGHTRDQVVRDVHAVERTMALEDQAVGDVEQLVKEETKRRRKP